MTETNDADEGPVGGGVCCNVLSLMDFSSVFSSRSLTPRCPPFRGPLRDLLAKLHPGFFCLFARGVVGLDGSVCKVSRGCSIADD